MFKISDRLERPPRAGHGTLDAVLKPFPIILPVQRPDAPCSNRSWDMRDAAAWLHRIPDSSKGWVLRFSGVYAVYPVSILTFFS
jgi:hypothetical protein